MRTALINNVRTKYDLCGSSKDSYNDFKNLIYIGEGSALINNKGEKLPKELTKHLFIYKDDNN